MLIRCSLYAKDLWVSRIRPALQQNKNELHPLEQFIEFRAVVSVTQNELRKRICFNVRPLCFMLIPNPRAELKLGWLYTI